MTDKRLTNGNYSLGGVDANMETIMRVATGKQNFLYPELDSIVSPDMTATIEKSDSTTDYTVTISGTAKKITSEESTSLFGAGTYTNVATLQIEVPTDYRGLTFKYGSESKTLTAKDTIEIDNRMYLIVPVGLYSNSGTVTANAGTVEIGYGIHSVKYELVVTGVTLES